ncbi:glycoside hydrolase family 35 protein [Antribacter gilvus]|uniref:glycoside hydrolase family 35 protein n=1 Tax=Antribacter gilvus TaxID=2304675 RepID=UPI000F77734F|nr:beta-galactosidase family protein [Antribacter gilvus]
MTSLTVYGAQLLRDGRSHRILSGALHYFRVHPDQWARQLRMLHAMGLNTVETYVPWNLHERDEGRYDFEGLADLERFVALADREGLDVIVRPGPFICAEWENGGLPAWLTARTGTRIRCLDDTYLPAVDRWFDELIPRVAAMQHTRGGPVSMVQVENEYGSYGSDAAYLEHLRAGLVARGIDVPLFTSDGDEDWMLAGGTLPGVLATVNFGSRAGRAFAALDKFRPDQPRICMEFWDGWFDHWGEDHTEREPRDAENALREILDHGGSVNLYMAQGGTSFGPWAGANRGGPVHDGEYQPTITSYDYDAPIDERGDPTETYWRFRDALLGFRRSVGDESEVPDVPLRLPELEEQAFRLVPVAGSAFAAAAGVSTSPVPTVEELGLDQGVVIHTAVVSGPRAPLPLRVTGVHDRASVYAAGRLVGSGAGPVVEVPLPAVPAEGLRIDVVVETLGRVNYGPLVGEPKGITGHVMHERQVVHGWTSRAVRLDELDRLARWDAANEAVAEVAPLTLTGTFVAPQRADTRLAVDGVDRGVAFVNGFCLGRFDAAGPQHSLYVPWPVVREGENTVTVVSLDPRTGTPTHACARLVRGSGFIPA